MIYVMSDIHGQTHKFFEMLNKINFSKNDTLYILGDIIDRGEGGFVILHYIKDKPNIKCTLGNHEQMMICGLYGDKSAFNCWLYNGGEVTYEQFMLFDAKKRNDVINQINTFKLYYEVNINNVNYILVHAGLRVRRGTLKSKQEILEEQNESDLLWIREDFYTRKAISKNNIVIFGHCPTFMINAKTTKYSWNRMNIWHDKKYGDKIGIDCGAGLLTMGGRLACLRLDDMHEFYV